MELNRIPLNRAEADALRGMVLWMRIGAVAAAVGAIAQILTALLVEGKTMLNCGGILEIWLAVVLFRAAGRFHLVATTDEADQLHLAEGINHLRVVFLAKSVVVIFGLSLAALAFVVFMLVAVISG